MKLKQLLGILLLSMVCTITTFGAAQIYGEATIDGAGKYAYVIDVEDHGEPGSNDTYWIILSNGYDSGRHTLDGGNVQIH